MATNFAIMRSKKLSSLASVASSLKHAYRERETPNADPARTPLNDAQGSTSAVMGKLKARLPEKRRKDAVVTIEYLLTASPDWWKSATPDQQAEFFRKAKTWLREKYGEANIVAEVIHRDETSPHLSAFVVPLTADGRLSAKEYIGNRAQMTKDQTSFANSVADLGLTRGIEGSKAKHQTIQRYYADLGAKRPLIEEAVSLLEGNETPAMREEREAEEIEEHGMPFLQAWPINNGRQMHWWEQVHYVVSFWRRRLGLGQQHDRGLER